MWREMIIFADRQSSKQAEISITEAHSNPLWSVDSRGAGQFFKVNLRNYIDIDQINPILKEINK